MFLRERQQITIFIVAAAVVGGFVLFRYLPLQRKIKAIKSARATQTLAISKGLAEAKQLPALNEQLQNLQRIVGNYDTYIPTQRALGGFLQKIADLMNEHNLKEQVVAPGEEVRADKLSCIPLDVHCKGKLAQIFEFYKRLQGLDRLVRIEQVKLENDTDFSGVLTMQTKAVICYRDQTAAGGQGI